MNSNTPIQRESKKTRSTEEPQEWERIIYDIEERIKFIRDMPTFSKYDSKLLINGLEQAIEIIKDEQTS